MRQELIEEVSAEFARQRERNVQEHDARVEKATAADPRIGALLKERQERFRLAAQEAFRRPEQAMERSARLKEEIAAINAQIRERLLAAGFPEDYLQPVYRCPKCKDTGFVGEVVRERCACFLQRLRQRSVERAGAGLNPKETFELFCADVFADAPLRERQGQTQRSYMELMRGRCQSYVDAYPDDPRRNLLLIGAAGLGKTYLLNCIGNALSQKGVVVLKLTSYQLTNRMRAAVFEHDWGAFSQVLETPVLLLDDLGAEPVINNVTIEQLFTLLNERELNGLHTLISTNLHPDELKQRYTERISSRMFDRRSTSILPFYGDDVRLRG